MSRIAGVLALLGGVFSNAAQAQETPDAIVRRELLAQAERARGADDHATAIECAQRALAIRATPSVHYFLAREYEAAGRVLQTLEAAGACVRGAEADLALSHRAVLLSACRAVEARTEGRVGRVTLRVASPRPAGATLRVAGSALGEAVLGVPYPVVPGVVRVEYAAPECETWSQEFTVAAGTSVTVDVPSLRALEPPPPPPPPLVVVVAPPPPAPHRDPPAPAPRRATALVVGGAVAVASFVTAGALFAAALGARSDRDGACRGDPLECDPSARDDDARYRTFTFVTDVALGVGAAALLTGGLVWWLVRPAPTARVAAPRVRFAPALDPRVGVGGALTISM